ncbi:MAG TPA: cytochrome P450 [Oligoflexus sp.]|uniref:cytochrome P450 n=1 Tax=Oligoflexus sp. TaxID=1971216 RepID=UPI002D7439C2|nr:cytochrome P450 [Oligoflexus sp.]HYX37762.1 cytochrome P450 [Oligoflexus sp.]
MEVELSVTPPLAKPTRPTSRPAGLDTLPIVEYGTDNFRENSVRIFAEACARGPVCRIMPFDVIGVTRFNDVDAIFRDPRTFSSNVVLAKQPEGTAEIGTLLKDDPPAHTRLRALFGQAFAPARVSSLMEPRVLAITKDLVRKVLDKGREFDLVEDFAVPLPVIVISELLGVDQSHMEDFKRWSDDVTGGTLLAMQPDSPSKVKRQAEIDQSLRSLDDYLVQTIKEYRGKKTGENLITFMINASQGGDKLTDVEILSLAKLLLVAGNETTTKSIGLAMNLLLKNPPGLKELSDSPGLIQSAMEEAVRLEGPVPDRLRKTLKDTRIGGIDIPAGTIIDAMIGAANLDASVFENPTTYDIRRKINRHVGFGGGIHQCLGAPLARLEMRIAYEEMLKHMQDFEPNGPAVRGVISAFRGFSSMPLRYKPRATQTPKIAVSAMEQDVAVADKLAKKSDNELGLDKRTREIVRVAKIRDIAKGVKLIRLTHPTGGLLTRFTAGSHIILHMRDGDKVYRNAYSLINSEIGNGLAYFIAVALNEKGQGGSNYIHKKLKPGMEISVSVPANNFPAADHAAKHLLIGGGIGITPLYAIRNELRSRGESSELHYTFRDSAHAALLEEFELEGSPSIKLYDNSLGQKLDLEALIRSQPEGTHAYVCGPEGLMDAVIETCATFGWPNEQVHFERFGAPKPKGELPFPVSTEISGMEFMCGSDMTLLEALEQQGLTIPYACRAGSCGACELNVVEGDLIHRDSVLSAAERSEGKILPCVSRARTRLVLKV